MFRTDNATAAAALPAPTAAGVNPDHYFSDGNPATSTPAAVVDAEFLNMIQEELVAVILGAGIALDKATRTQLRAAITAMISGASKAVIIEGTTFEASVADGETVYWDAGNNRFDEAMADGSATNMAVGIADVTNAQVVCFGETRANLVSGLTPGAKYYLDGAVAGGINTVAPDDQVTVGIAKTANIIFVDIDAGAGATLLQGKYSIPVLARSLTPTTTVGCAKMAQGETPVNKINYEYMAFDASIEAHCFIKFPAPKSSDETAGIYIRNLKWSHPATTVNFDVVWGFAMLAIGNDDALDAALGAEVTVTDTGGTTEDLYSAPESAVIAPAGAWAEGDTLYLEVTRVAADVSDTLAVGAFLHEFELIITSNAGNDA